MNRFLIIRIGALGDIVHAIPVAAALRRAYPHAQIDWLVSDTHRAILDLVPVIDRLLVVGNRPASGGRSFAQVIREMRRAPYDAALDLQGLIKSAVIARSSGARRVIGFARGYLREPLARVFYTEMYDPGGPGMFAPGEIRHVIQTNLGMLERLGIAASTPEFPFATTESAVAREVGERSGGRYALFNPGAGWPNKRWPPDRLGAVAAWVSQQHHLQSYVLWGPGEEELARAVVAGSSGTATLLPPTSVADVIALARGAVVMVSGDTGPTQIAAAVGTPIVGIFGPTRPERNGSWHAHDISVSRAAVCQCHHRRSCRLSSMCLLDVSVSEVIDAVERRLSGSQAAVQ